MYNIHSHYENILSYAKSIVVQPTVAYLHPFGATGPENIELINNGGVGRGFLIQYKLVFLINAQLQRKHILM